MHEHMIDTVPMALGLPRLCAHLDQRSREGWELVGTEQVGVQRQRVLSLGDSAGGPEVALLVFWRRPRQQPATLAETVAAIH